MTIFVQQSRTAWTVLVEGLMRNICVKLFDFSGLAVQEEILFKMFYFWFW